MKAEFLKSRSDTITASIAAALLCAGVLAPAPAAHASEAGFLKLCDEIATLPEATKKTVWSLMRLGSGTFVGTPDSCADVVADLKKRTRIQLHGQTFEYFDVADLSPVAELDWIEELDVTNQGEVNDLTALAKLPKLRKLEIGGTQAPLQQLELLPELTSVAVSATTFTSLEPIAVLPKLEEVVVFPSFSTYLGALAKAPKLRSITVDIWPAGSAGSKITGLNQLKRLESFRATEVEVDVAELAHLPLKTLHVINGAARNIPAVAAIGTLESLALTAQAIEEVEFLRNLTELRSLTLSQNRIRYAPALAELTKLRTLDLRENQLWDDSPIRDLVELEHLDLGTNHLGSVRIDKLSRLKYLDLRDTGLYQFEVQDAGAIFPALEEIKLDSNALRSGYTRALNGAVMPALKRLDLAYNKLTTVDHLATITTLESLQLDDNKIQGDLSELAPLVNLTYLSARYNLLTDLSCPLPKAGARCDFLHQEI